MKFEKALDKLMKVKTPKGFITCLFVNGDHFTHVFENDAAKFIKVVKGKVQPKDTLNLEGMKLCCEGCKVQIVNIKLNTRNW